MKKNPNYPATPAPWLRLTDKDTAPARLAGAAALSTTLIVEDALVQQLRAVHTTYHDALPGPWTVTSTTQNSHKRNT